MIGKIHSGRDTAVTMLSFLVMMIIVSPAGPEGILLPGRGIIVHLSGNVEDDTGAAVSDALVVALNMNGSVLDSAYTNLTGEFRLNMTLETLGTPLNLMIIKEGFFQKLVEETPGSVNEKIGTVTITPLPEETENVSGHIRYPDGAPVEGVDMTIEYDGPEGMHRYEGSTGSEGEFSFRVFPADYDVRGTLSNISVVEEELTVNPGEGPYILNMTIDHIPPIDSLLRGYVTDGDGAVAGAVVGLRNLSLEMGAYALTGPDGYYELDMWQGEQILLSMKEGFDVFFTSVLLSSSETSWMNLTLDRERYYINGTVNDEHGSPLEGITIQLARPHSMMMFNEDRTDESGAFSIMVPEGEAYFMAMEKSPFDSENYGVCFLDLHGIDSDREIVVTLHDALPAEDCLIIDLDNFTSMGVSSKMGLRTNESMAARATIDNMMGDGDLILSAAEGDRFMDFLLRENPDLTEGQFGTNSRDNITIEGHPFLLAPGSLKFELLNVTGPVASASPMALELHSTYEMEGTLEGNLDRVNVSMNGTYSTENEERTVRVPVPEGWRFLDHTPTIHNISERDGRISIRAAHDPDPDDDEDSEWFTLTLVNDSFGVRFEEPGPVFEGRPCVLRGNITDMVPGNTRTFTWEIDGLLFNTTSPELVHTFPENGTYDVLLIMTDVLGRRAVDFIQLEVMNRNPEAAIEVEGGSNRTFHEGDRLVLVLNASDVPSDPLHFQWSIQGSWTENFTYDLSNRTMEVELPDDGNFSVAVMVFDDDGGSSFRELPIHVLNLPPTADLEMNGLNEYDMLEQGKWLEIVLNVSDVASDTVTVRWELPDTGSMESERDGPNLRLRFLDSGDYRLSLIVEDEDGGILTGNWTIQVIGSENFDNDGDGMPRWWEKLHELNDDDPSDADGDGDLDGLSNLKEYTNGTDPHNRDTDSDGIPDDYEVRTGTNPILDDGAEDPDGDGISNLEEYLKGSDPLDPKDPGKEKDGNSTIFIIMLAAGIILFIGAALLLMARKKQTGLLTEE